MTQLENKNLGFFKELINRRVIRITGFYLGGSWGVLQFLDWIVERYLLSPQLVDLLLTIVVSLVPSIVIMAYFHGSPGKNMWKKTEKIFIPANFLLMLILVLFLFGNKNLSSIARRVSLTDETGKKIEKVVPKKGVVKELTVFFFENKSGSEDADWMQYGLPSMLIFDISQDPFLNSMSPASADPLKGFYIYQKLKDAGFPEGTGAPLMLKKKIAEDLNAENFLSGSILRTGKMIELKASLYLTKDNSVVEEKIISGDNIFSLTDKLTLFLKKSLKLPSYKNTEIVDLPVRDMTSNSVKAVRLAAEGEIETFKNNNYGAAQKLYEDAVKEDNTFTIAYTQLSEIYALNNNMDKWKSTIKKTMKHLYKLPEKLQMQLRAGYYLAVKGEPEKAESLLKMIIKLYPNDIKNYSTLAYRFYLTGNYKEAIVYYKKILEMEPGRYEIYDKIGKAYESDGDTEKALENYVKYSEKFPKKASGFLKIGNIEEKRGNFEEASKLYEKALLLDPEKISTILMIARLDIKSGKFKGALDKYEEALQTSKNFREKSSIYSSMEDYYKLRGQQKKAMEMMNSFYRINNFFLPPLQNLIVKVITVNIFLKNGKEKKVKKLLDQAKEKLSPPFDKVVSIGYILYHKHRGELNRAESYLKDIDDFVKLTGNKQFLILGGRIKADIAYLRAEYVKALTLYKKNLEKDNSNISTILKISECLKSTGKLKESIEYIKKGLKLSPYHPEVNYAAAQFYSAAKEKDKALLHVKKAVNCWGEADYDFIPAIKAKELLNKLNSGGGDVE